MLRTALTFIVFILTTTGLWAQTSWVVDASAASGGNGSSSQPFQTIMEAVNASVSGDFIYLSPGSYDGGTVDLGLKNLTISSLLGASTVTIINNVGFAGKFKIDGIAGGATTLTDLTFSGVSAGFQLVISVQNTQLNVIDCVFERSDIQWLPSSNPSSTPPPQLFVDGCVFDNSKLNCEFAQRPIGTTATIINSDFKFITTGYFAQYSRLAYSQVLLDNCHFEGSSLMRVIADSGSIKNCLFENNLKLSPALEIGGSNVQVSSSTFSRCGLGITCGGFSQVIESSTFEGCGSGVGNSSIANSVIRDCSFTYLPQGTGPFYSTQQGINSLQGALTVDRCTFRGLQGSNQGGAVHAAAPLTLANCSFQDCDAQSMGGAIFVDQTYVDIGNCSFVDNTAPLGATLHVGPGSPGSVRNSIIRGSSAQHVSGQPSLSYCNVEGGWSGPGSENFDLDPLFVDVANGDLHLGSASPCLDAGDYDSLGLTLLDRDSNPRLSGKYVDIGCYESSSLAPTLTGTQEDLQMIAKRNGARINTDSLTVTGGDVISLKMLSPHHGFDGFPLWLMGELFATGGSPILPAGHPAVHLNLSIADVLFDPSLTSAVPGWTLGLPATGIDLNGLVPFGFAGKTYRLQAFLLSYTALNSWYASTAAFDLVHQ